MSFARFMSWKGAISGIRETAELALEYLLTATDLASDRASAYDALIGLCLETLSGLTSSFSVIVFSFTECLFRFNGCLSSYSISRCCLSHVLAS